MQKIICICCPVGCHLDVNGNDKNSIKVAGAKCSRGISHAEEEIISPKRMITAVVKSNSKHHPYIPVKTSHALPREEMGELLKTLYSLKVEIPVQSGDIAIQDFKSSGVNVIFTRSVIK